MASSTSPVGGAGALARGQARAILAEGRFHEPSIPRPLHGLLETVGNALESPLELVGELVSKLAAITPGGSIVVWAALAALVLALSGTLALRGTRRSLREPGLGAAASVAPPSATELERRAVAAEAGGLHGEAVRLRFRAGLLLLAESERVTAAPTMLNAEVSRALRSERFDRLARRFDEIVYGGRPAGEEDAESSRREWKRLLSAGGGER